ncbi:hypothetical protein H5U35_06710, partial [Candidatus Aerophobetes bacterium]|nr:hypothetical protein [Candidatus Aerophobetes bacterium]
AGSFWYARLFSTVTVPWFILLIWYVVPALYGKIDSLILDLSWAIISAYSAGIGGGIIEKNVERSGADRSFKVFVIILIILSAFLYIWFTYRLPWIDLFAGP